MYTVIFDFDAQVLEFLIYLMTLLIMLFFIQIKM